MGKPTVFDPARIAYEAFREHSKEPLPPWETVTPTAVARWTVVARAVIDATIEAFKGFAPSAPPNMARLDGRNENR